MTGSRWRGYRKTMCAERKGPTMLPIPRRLELQTRDSAGHDGWRWTQISALIPPHREAMLCALWNTLQQQDVRAARLIVLSSTTNACPHRARRTTTYRHRSCFTARGKSTHRDTAQYILFTFYLTIGTGRRPVALGASTPLASEQRTCSHRRDGRSPRRRGLATRTMEWRWRP